MDVHVYKHVPRAHGPLLSRLFDTMHQEDLHVAFDFRELVITGHSIELVDECQGRFVVTMLHESAEFV